jgi:hypothetical protein
MQPLHVDSRSVHDELRMRLAVDRLLKVALEVD